MAKIEIFTNFSQSFFDLSVHLIRGEIDETRRKIGDQRRKLQAFF